MSYSDSRRRSQTPPTHRGAAGGASTLYDAQDAPRDGIEFLQHENQRLLRENREMRRCLILVKENCELKNLNYLSQALTVTDAQLRKFLRDAVVSAPRNSMASAHVPKSSSDGNVLGPPYPTDTPLFHPTAAIDSTYGQSFQELQYNDIASTFGERSVFSNSYGRSFAELDAVELAQSQNRDQSKLQSSLNERNIKWVDYNSYNNDGMQSRSVATSMKREQSASTHQRRSDSAESGSRITRQQNIQNVRTLEGKTQTSESAARFYDSLETSQQSHDLSPTRSNPPMRFSLNPNPLFHTADIDRPADTQRGTSENISKESSRRHDSANQTVLGAKNISQMSENNRTLHISDLETSNHPSAFKQYKGDQAKNTSVQFQKTTREYQGQGSNTSENLVQTEYRSRSVTPEGIRQKTVSRGVYQGQGRFTLIDHPPTCTCTGCHDFSRQVAKRQDGSRPKSPLSTQLFVEEDQSNGGSNPKMIVRVNTTLGRPDENNGVEKVQMSDVYAIPMGARSPTPTLLDRKVTVNKESAAEKSSHNAQWTSKGRPRSVSPFSQQMDTSLDRLRSRSPSFPQPGTSKSRPRSPSPSASRNHRSRSPISVDLSTPPIEKMRNEKENDSYRDQAMSISELSDRPMYTNERSNYKTAVSFEPESFRPDNAEYRLYGTMEIPRQTRHGERVPPRRDRDSGNRSTSFGKPVATSTPRQTSPRQRLFKTELQSRRQLNDHDSRYDTAQSTIDPSYIPTPPNDYPGYQPTRSLETHAPPIDMTRSRKSPVSIEFVPTGSKQVRCSSAPPMIFGQDAIEMGNISVGRTTPTKSILKSPRPSSPGPNLQDTYVLLAYVLGFKGRGAAEKVKSFLYRAVDILTGYEPRVNRDTCRLLETNQPHRRMVGEIAFQLDRRVLEFIIAGYSHHKLSFRYYGYSLTNILNLIKKESTMPDGYIDRDRELSLRRRLEYIMNKLSALGYNFNFHAGFTQDMVNKYGLLNISSQDTAEDKYGLKDIGLIRLKLCQLLKLSCELDNMMIIFDCLCYLSYEDGRPTFIS